VFQDGAHVFPEVGAPRCGAWNELLLQVRAFRPLDPGLRYALARKRDRVNVDADH